MDILTGFLVSLVVMGAGLGWRAYRLPGAVVGTGLGMLAAIVVGVAIPLGWEAARGGRPGRLLPVAVCRSCMCPRCAELTWRFSTRLGDEDDPLESETLRESIAWRLRDRSEVGPLAVLAIDRPPGRWHGTDDLALGPQAKWARSVLGALGCTNRIVITASPQILAALAHHAGARWRAWSYDPLFVTLAQRLAQSLPACAAGELAEATAA